MAEKIPDPPTGSIPLVVSCDENYAPHMCVMLVSLLENASSPSRVHIYVLDGGIKDKTGEIIKKEIQKRKGVLNFIDFDHSRYKNFKLRRNMSPSVYYRISIPELFSGSVTKAIYLDCDLIVKGDISELWNYPFQGNHIAAVQDLSNSTYLASGLPQHKYFNSGVMLIDLDLWRRDNIAEKVRKFKVEHPEKIRTNDQCALNGVLFDSWARLPLRWNQQAGIYRPTRGRLRHFSRKEIDEAIWNPGIIHYIGGKPWNYPCFHPLEGEYFHYLKKTCLGAKLKEKDKNLKTFLTWSLQPKFLKKYIRKMIWQHKYATQAKLRRVKEVK
ncbi:MAG: glycosyltransferase family 8 protein [Desulfobacterales bacterium]